MATNPPRLKGSRLSPLVVVPSGKIQKGYQASLRTSIASYRSIICWTTLSLSCLVPALSKKRDYRPLHRADISGASSNAFLGVNPGHNGLVIKFSISMNPIWLHMTTDGLPSPLFGTRFCIGSNGPLSESACINGPFWLVWAGYSIASPNSSLAADTLEVFLGPIYSSYQLTSSWLMYLDVRTVNNPKIHTTWVWSLYQNNRIPLRIGPIGLFRD